MVSKEAEEILAKEKEIGRKTKKTLLLGIHWALNTNEDYPSELEFAMYYARDIKGL